MIPRPSRSHHGRAADEDRTLQRVVHLLIDAPGDRRKQPVGGPLHLTAGIHEEMNRSHRCSSLSGAKQALPKEGGLLIAGNPSDGNLRAEKIGRGDTRDSRAGHHLGQHLSRDSHVLDELGLTSRV